jgi:hypothetical protein
MDRTGSVHVMALGKCFEVVRRISRLARHQRFMHVVIFKTAQNINICAKEK